MRVLVAEKIGDSGVELLRAAGLDVTDGTSWDRTELERRVAELAEQGLTNREIAQALFVSTKTVEFHLRNAYFKLRIRSRAELGEALRADRVSGATVNGEHGAARGGSVV